MFENKLTKSSIQKKSESALSMFRNAMQNLEDASEQARTLFGKNQEKIKDLQSENSDLNVLISDNEKVVNNISDLIGKGE